MANPELEQYKKNIKEKLEVITSILANIAVGDFSKRLEIPDQEDEFTELYAGLNFMIEDLATGTVALEYVENSINKVLDIIQKVARGDYSTFYELSGKNDIFDALGMGLNIMIEDLSSVTVSRDYVDNIIKSMIDTLIVTDAEGKIKTVNQATLDLLGYEEKEIIGKPAGILFAEEEEEELLFKGTKWEKLLKDGVVRDYSMTYKTKSGEKIPVSFSGTVMYSPGTSGKEIIGIVGIARDMREIIKLQEKEKEFIATLATAAESEKKRAEELQALNQQLEAKEQALRSKMAELERFNKLMVGRELEMIKLKEEINSLLEKLGQPKKYKVPEKIAKEREGN